MKMALVRERIHAIATQLHYRGDPDRAKELHFYAEATRRRPSLRRRRQARVGPTDRDILNKPGMKTWIRVLRHEQGLTYDEIGRITGVTNVGRLSETCEGYKQ